MMLYNLHLISNCIIEKALENNISTIIIGYNKNWKNRIKKKRKIGYNFKLMPYRALVDMILNKAQEIGIKVKLVEESFTSKTDHLALENMIKKESYLGVRKKRGLFISSIGKSLNADINGAIGIMRKAKVFSDADLISLRGRGDIVSP